MIRGSGLVALLLLLAACGSYYETVVAPRPDIEDAPGYYQLHYDYEVGQICGLVSRKVHDTFKLNQQRLAQKSGMDGEELRRIRIHAMAAADKEYGNRGLGGHRPWCRTSGKSGIKRILSGIHLKAG